MPESEPFVMNLDLSWVEDDEGNLVVTGCASVPEPDDENEIVTKEAIETALPDFMQLSILHLDHSERPVGPITESWFEDDKFMIRGPIKPTDDCTDVRIRIKSGELSQFSIFGRRISGTPSCRLNPSQRSETCKTTRLFLDSVSICPKGNAINGNSYLEHNGGGIVEKAITTDSAMIHTTADGTEEKNKMDENAPAPAGDTGPGPDVLQQILDRLEKLEQLYDELTSVEPEDVQKAEDGGDYDPEYDAGGDEPDLKEYLTTIGDALQMILSNQQEMMQRKGTVGKPEIESVAPGDGEPEDDGYEEEEDDLEKGCGSVKKSVVSPDQSDVITKALDRIEKLEQNNEALKADNEILRKSVVELSGKLKPREVVVVPNVKEESNTGNPGEGPVELISGLLGA
jgi:hypothetical protein